MDPLQQHIEALFFSSPKPVKPEEVLLVLEEVFGTRFMADYIDQLIHHIENKYSSPSFAFELKNIDNGYIFLTKPEYKDTITTHIKQQEKKKLSAAALEVLAIIAYRQPITRLEIEEIRGVNSDYLLQKLLEKELIAISGRSEGPGKPLLYKTSDRFLNHFGLKSIEELPKLKELTPPENSIGATMDYL